MKCPKCADGQMYEHGFKRDNNTTFISYICMQCKHQKWVEDEGSESKWKLRTKIVK